MLSGRRGGRRVECIEDVEAFRLQYDAIRSGIGAALGRPPNTTHINPYSGIQVT